MTRREQLEQLLAASPGDAFLQYAVAMTCLSDGQPAEAARRLADINQQHPDNVAAWFQRGKVLAQLGEEDDARSVINSGIAVARRVGDSHAEGEMRAFLDML